MNHRHHVGCRASRGASPREFALPNTSTVYERDRPFRAPSLALELTIDLAGGAVSGRATLAIERVDAAARTLRLDAVSLDVSRVTIGGVEARFVDDGEALHIDVPDGATHEVVIEYSAHPARGMYFFATEGSPPQAWTQLQDEDARHVFPCIDKPHEKFTFEARLTVPRGLSALSNGALRERVEHEDHSTFHWVMQHPLPAYLVSIAVGDFEIVEDGAVGDAAVSYWVPRGRTEAVARSLGRTRAMMERFGALLGVPYPFEKYAQIVVDNFSFGGMENTTATTLYEHALLDERAALDVTSDDLVAHELAHHWFGDLVTCRDFSHGWLNEGFATFFEHLDREAHLGDDDYLWGLRVDQEAYLGEAKGRYERAIVSHTYEAPIDLFDRHLYEKGGLVLHLLRRGLGDAAFFAGVGAYLRAHAHGVVETRDLMRALEAASGRALDRFFDEWVHRPGHADVSVSVTWSDGALRVDARQPAARAFALTLELEVRDADGTYRTETLRLDGPEARARFACPERPAHVAVDPRHLLVGDLTTHLTADWHRSALRLGQTARSRWLAATALGRLADPRSLAALAATLADEVEFWGVRVMAATALGDARGDAAHKALVAATGTRHPKVRRAVIAALGAWRGESASAPVAAAAGGDASILVEAEALRTLGKSRHPSAFDALIAALPRSSWGDTIACGAAEGLASLRDPRAVEPLLARTSPVTPSRLRRAAIRALPSLSREESVREALEDLLDDRDPHVRVEVIAALLQLGAPESAAAIGRALGREREARVRRRMREALRDLATADKDDLRRLADRVDELERRDAELRARVAKLEAETPST